MGASFVEIKADLDEAMAEFEYLDVNQKKIRKRILSGVGSATKSAIKKQYKTVLKKRSGNLYRKGIVKKVVRSGKAVVISPMGVRSENQVFYGSALTKGSLIKPTKKNSSKLLTFKIGDKWIRKHSVKIPQKDFISGPGERYLNSAECKKKIEQLTAKEIAKAEAAAKTKAKK